MESLHSFERIQMKHPLKRMLVKMTVHLAMRVMCSIIWPIRWPLSLSKWTLTTERTEVLLWNVKNGRKLIVVRRDIGSMEMALCSLGRGENECIQRPSKGHHDDDKLCVFGQCFIKECAGEFNLNYPYKSHDVRPYGRHWWLDADADVSVSVGACIKSDSYHLIKLLLLLVTQEWKMARIYGTRFNDKRLTLNRDGGEWWKIALQENY